MTQTTIINKLDELSYKGFKEAYLHQLEDTHYSNIGFLPCLMPKYSFYATNE